MFPILFFLFFLIPLIEIYLLIQIGSAIGPLLTIAGVVLTAMIGAFLIRRQGMSTFARFQGKLQSGEIPAREMADGFCLLIAGALLMTPGFFTDSMGFVLLMPPVRGLIYKRLSKFSSAHIITPNPHTSSPHQPSQTKPPLETEYKKIDD